MTDKKYVYSALYYNALEDWMLKSCFEKTHSIHGQCYLNSNNSKLGGIIDCTGCQYDFQTCIKSKTQIKEFGDNTVH